jgi:hypothetical protein
MRLVRSRSRCRRRCFCRRRREGEGEAKPEADCAAFAVAVAAGVDKGAVGAFFFACIIAGDKSVFGFVLPVSVLFFLRRFFVAVLPLLGAPVLVLILQRLSLSAG